MCALDVLPKLLYLSVSVPTKPFGVVLHTTWFAWYTTWLLPENPGHLNLLKTTKSMVYMQLHVLRASAPSLHTLWYIHIVAALAITACHIIKHVPKLFWWIISKALNNYIVDSQLRITVDVARINSKHHAIIKQLQMVHKMCHTRNQISFQFFINMRRKSRLRSCLGLHLDCNNRDQYILR